MLLSEAMKEYIENPDKKRAGYNLSKYNKRLVEDVTSAFKDLTFLTQKLPEKLQDKVFGDELSDFFTALLKPSSDSEMTKEERERRRIRILRLVHGILFHLGDVDTAYKLAPTATKFLMRSTNYDIALKAILMESLSR
jgi:hypothetical protein